MPRRNRPKKSHRNSSRRSSSRRRGQYQRGDFGDDGQFGDFGRIQFSDSQRVETSSDGEWNVREVPAWRAVKPYTCPSCHGVIPQGQPHIVAWRADWIMGDEQAGEYRRHWHSACWRNRRQDMRY